MNRCFVVFVLAMVGCESNTPLIPARDPLVHFNFEGDLGNIGSVAISGQSYDGEAEFADGKYGNALFSLGDGRWVEYSVDNTISLNSYVDISFDFRRADWVNPYKNGSGTQTAAVISSVDPSRITHISFNISNGPNPNLQVAFRNAAGKRYRLRSDQGFDENDWHNVKLRVDKQDEETRLYIDDVQIDYVGAVPTVIENGIDRIKFGTWYKKNQAYRGEIDNFLIIETAAP